MSAGYPFSSMDTKSFPVEIINHILRVSDKQTLKSWRLCSHWLESEATPILFDELVITPSVNSFTALIRLARNSSIQRAVRHLRYDVYGIFPEFFSLDEQGKLRDIQYGKLSPLRAEYPGFTGFLKDLLESWLYPAGQDFPGRLTISQTGKIKADFQCDLNWLTEILGHYPHVNHISMTNNKFEYRLAPRSRVPRPLPRFFQKWFEDNGGMGQNHGLTLASSIFDSGWYKVEYYRARCLLLALCNHHHRRFDVQIESLVEDGGILWFEFGDIGVRDLWRKHGLRNLDSLQFVLNEDTEPEPRRNRSQRDVAQNLVRDKKPLQLTLHFHYFSDATRTVDPRIWSESVFGLVQHLTLGHLSVSGAIISSFMKVATPRLRVLKLQTIRLHSLGTGPLATDSWIYMINFMAQELNLESIEFLGVLNGGTDEDFTVSSPRQLHSLSKPGDANSTKTRAFFNMVAYYNLSHLSRLEHVNAHKMFPDQGTDGQILSGNTTCLRDRVSNYITHKGPYPYELTEYDERRPSQDIAVLMSPKPRFIGDSSWLMLL